MYIFDKKIEEKNNPGYCTSNLSDISMVRMYDKPGGFTSILFDISMGRMYNKPGGCTLYIYSI